MFIDTFKKNIKNKKGQFTPLKPSTVEAKRKKGYSKPSVPLYGKGESDRRSLINVYKLKKRKTGYEVSPKSGKHWSGASYKEILGIHEKGTAIIPERTPFEKARDKVIQNKKIKETSKKLQKEFVQTFKNFSK